MDPRLLGCEFPNPLMLAQWEIVFPARFSIQPLSFVILMNQEQFFFLILKSEFYVLSHDAETYFSYSNIDSGIDIAQEWSPKYARHSQIAFHVENHKVHKYEGIIDSYQ